MGVLSALVIASSALQVAGQVQQGRGLRRAAADAVGEGNRAADDALRRGAFEADRYQMQLSQLLGRQRAAAGASGIDAGFGSAAQVRAEAERVGAADIAMIEENAMREARGLRRQGQNAATQMRAQATGAYAGAFGTLLSAGAQGWALYQAGRTNVLRAMPGLPSRSAMTVARPTFGVMGMP